MEVVYEDNHIIIVNKQSGEIVQGDKTGDRPLSDIVKDYIKEKYQKPGAVFLGVVHRLDRPVSGLVVFARTSKALTRLNKMFAEGEVHKTYWAIVKNTPHEPEGTLIHWLVSRAPQCQEGHLKIPCHRPLCQLQSVGSAADDRSPPSDPLSVGSDGLSHQGRSEVWGPPKQS